MFSSKAQLDAAAKVCVDRAMNMARHNVGVMQDAVDTPTS